jgi:hypothetical protein
MNDFYKEIIRKVHPDVNPDLANATRICQEVNKWKDNPSMLKEIAQKYNIKVSFVGDSIKVEFVEGARVVFIKNPHSRRIKRLSGVICRVRAVKTGKLVGATEFTIKIEKDNGFPVEIDYVEKVKTFSPESTFSFVNKLSETEFAQIREKFASISNKRDADDPGFFKWGLKPNTDYDTGTDYSRRIAVLARIGRRWTWVTVVRTTDKGIKYRNYGNASGLGFITIEKVFDVRTWW